MSCLLRHAQDVALEYFQLARSIMASKGVTRRQFGLGVAASAALARSA